MMSKKQKEQWLRVSTLLAETPEGMSIQALLDALAALDISTKEADSNTVAPPRRTLQSWLKKWVEQGLLRWHKTRKITHNHSGFSQAKILKSLRQQSMLEHSYSGTNELHLKY